MAELLTPDANGDTNQYWGPWITAPVDDTDQVHSGTKSTKWVSVADGSGIASPYIALNPLSRVIKSTWWVRVSRTQPVLLYHIFFDVNGTPTYLAWTADVVADTWQKFVIYGYAQQRPSILESALPSVNIQLLIYSNYSLAGDVFWTDSNSLTDDTGDLALKTWTGNAWVPRRMRRF